MGSPYKIVGYDRKNPDIAQISKESKVYGVANKPRNQDPSMKDLLTWSVPEDQRSQFKTGNQIKLNQANEIEKYQLKINQSSTDWVTENHDNFRKYGKPAPNHEQDEEVFPVDIRVIEQIKGASPSQNQEQITDQPYNTADYHTQINPKQCSTYQQQYSIQDIKNLDTLRRALIQNKDQKHGHEDILYTYDDGRENKENQPNQKEEEPDVEEEQNEESENKGPEYETFIKKKKKKVIKTKKLDPIYEKERLKRRKERIKQFKLASRELPNSAFTSYYGKVPFENYGNKNVQPAVGGFCYGNYMRSHNVNPHRGDNQPEYVQSYNNSLVVGLRNPVVEHQPPRIAKEQYRLSQNQVEHLQNRSQIVPPQNIVNDSLKLIKPDLEVQRRFASQQNSLADSEQSDNEDVVISKDNQKNQPQQQARPESQDGTIQQQVVIKQDQGDGQQNQDKQQANDPDPVDSAVYESEDPARKNFIQDLKEQKLHKNRLAKKVTEVVPDLQRAQVKATERPRSANPAQNQSQISRAEQSTIAPDLSEYNEFELNPKNYKNVDQKWLERIPFAGKQQEKSQDVQSVFYNDD